MSLSVPPGLSTADLQWNESAWNLSQHSRNAQKDIRFLITLHNLQLKELRRQIREFPNSVQGLKDEINEKDDKIRTMTNTDKRKTDLIVNLEKKVKKKVELTSKSVEAKLKSQISTLENKTRQIIQIAANEVNALKRQVQDMPTSAFSEADAIENGDAYYETKMALDIAEGEIREQDREIKRLEAQVRSLQEDIKEMELTYEAVAKEVESRVPESWQDADGTDERQSDEVKALEGRISAMQAKEEEMREHHQAAMAELEEQYLEGENRLNHRIADLQAELSAAHDERDAAITQRMQVYEHPSEAQHAVFTMQRQMNAPEQRNVTRTASDPEEDIASVGGDQGALAEAAQAQSGHVRKDDIRNMLQDDEMSTLMTTMAENAQDSNGDLFEEDGNFEIKVNLPKKVAADAGYVDQPLLDLEVDEHEACGFPVLAAGNHTSVADHEYGSAVARIEPAAAADQDGYQNGLAVGVYKGRIEGRIAGHQAGIEEGFLDGFEMGRAEGMRQVQFHRADAIRSAYADGEVAGFQDGFTRGIAQALQSSIEEVS